MKMEWSHGEMGRDEEFRKNELRIMQLKRTSRKNFRKDIAKPVRGYEDGGMKKMN